MLLPCNATDMSGRGKGGKGLGASRPEPTKELYRLYEKIQATEAKLYDAIYQVGDKQPWQSATEISNIASELRQIANNLDRHAAAIIGEKRPVDSDDEDQPLSALIPKKHKK